MLGTTCKFLVGLVITLSAFALLEQRPVSVPPPALVVAPVSTTQPIAYDRPYAPATPPVWVRALLSAPTAPTATPVPAQQASPPVYRELGVGESVRTLTVDEWAWLQRWFPDDEQRMARTVTCESMWRDDVVSVDGAIGRLQIMPGWATRYGYDPAQLHDPEVAGYVGQQILALHPDGHDWAGMAGCPAWSAQ